MVDDLKDHAFIDVIDRLLLLVVVDQDELFMLVIEQMVTGDRTDDLALVV